MQRALALAFRVLRLSTSRRNSTVLLLPRRWQTEREKEGFSPRVRTNRETRPPSFFSLPLPLLAGLLPASILPATLGSPFHPGHNAKIARRLPHCPAHRHLQNLQNWKNAASQCLYYMCERVYTRGWGKGGREKSEDTVDRYSNEPFVPARSLARRSRRIHRERWQRWQWWQWWVWRTWSLSPSLSPWLIQWSSREAVDSCSLSPVAPPPSRSKITRIVRSIVRFFRKLAVPVAAVRRQIIVQIFLFSFFSFREDVIDPGIFRQRVAAEFRSFSGTSIGAVSVGGAELAVTSAIDGFSVKKWSEDAEWHFFAEIPVLREIEFENSSERHWSLRSLFLYSLFFFFKFENTFFSRMKFFVRVIEKWFYRDRERERDKTFDPD